MSNQIHVSFFVSAKENEPPAAPVANGEVVMDTGACTTLAVAPLPEEPDTTTTTTTGYLCPMPEEEEVATDESIDDWETEAFDP